jgi:hypothetical protein
MYLLTVLIFSLLGCYIYNKIQYKDYINKLPTSNELFNFDNFFQSFLLNLSIYQGQSWEYYILEYSNVNRELIDGWVAYVYFSMSYFFCNTIMMNLFLLIIISKYDTFHRKEENPILKFEEMIEVFQIIWSKYSDDGGQILKLHKLDDCLKDIFESNEEKISPKFESELKLIK